MSGVDDDRPSSPSSRDADDPPREPVEEALAEEKRLFQAAIEVPSDQRAAWLDEACRDRPRLRARLDRLLAFQEKSSLAPDWHAVIQSAGDELLRMGDRSRDLDTRSRLAGMAGGRPNPLRLADLTEEAPLPDLKMGVEKYEILGELGSGGMGDVYLAYDQDLDRRVALKIMRLHSADEIRRFVEEAKVMAQPDLAPGLAGSSRPPLGRERGRCEGERDRADGDVVHGFSS